MGAGQQLVPTHSSMDMQGRFHPTMTDEIVFYRLEVKRLVIGKTSNYNDLIAPKGQRPIFFTHPFNGCA